MKHTYRIGVLLSLVAGVAVAQNPPTAGAQPAKPAQGQAGQVRQAGRAQARVQPNRAQLEQQIRARIAGALKKNLNLSDDQFAKLQATNKRFEERRHLLVEQERDARMGMRDLIFAGDTTNQGKVSAALDKMLQIQRQRFELVEQEQKELAGYLTPMQRARYLGMQEQMFRRVEALRQQGGGRGGPGGPGGPPMGAGMGPGMGQGMGAGMGPGAGQGIGAQGRLRNPGRPLQGQPRPPGTVPPEFEIIP